MFYFKLISQLAPVAMITHDHTRQSSFPTTLYLTFHQVETKSLHHMGQPA